MDLSRLPAVTRRCALVALLALVAMLGACSDSAPPAPSPEAAEIRCTPSFCVDVPGDWEVVEETDEFVSLRHRDAPETVVATVGPVSMEGVVGAAGGRWPQRPDAVVRYFWTLIDGGEAEMETLDTERGGAVSSFGHFADGRLWYRLVPVDSSTGIGAEMRAPDATWAVHANLILGSVTP